MGNIKIKNLSTLEDGSAVVRVGMLMCGEVEQATTDHKGKHIIKIHFDRGTYIVTDKE